MWAPYSPGLQQRGGGGRGRGRGRVDEEGEGDYCVFAWCMCVCMCVVFGVCTIAVITHTMGKLHMKASLMGNHGNLQVIAQSMALLMLSEEM